MDNARCVLCKNEMEEEKDVTPHSITWYCVNGLCERYGLLTVMKFVGVTNA